MYEFEKNKLKAHLDKLYEVLKDYNCIIAGGMVTSLFCNREINDVDVYFRSAKDLRDFILEYVKNNSNMWIVSKTKKALLIHHSDTVDLQLICFKMFDSAEDIFDTFDFTVCMGAFDFKTEEFALHSDFLKHNAQRILMFNDKTAYPIVSALRVDKYKQKGYTISKTEYIRVLLTCMSLNIDNYEDLKQQLGGMYGVDYDDVIKPLEEESFDLQTVITKMSDIIMHPDYFKKKSSCGIEIDDWYVLISEMTGEKIPCYDFKDSLYIYSDEDGFEKLSDSKKNKYKDLLEAHSLYDFFKDGLYLYKNVEKRSDGKLFSHYDKAFEYKIGEYAVARGKGWNNKEVGLFVEPLRYVREHYYNKNKDNVVIELKLDSIDDFMDLEQFTIKKGLVTRILDSEPIENKGVRGLL